MGRPPSTGGPAFRFTHAEVAEMEERLRHLNNAIPHRDVIQGLADKFTASPVRSGKIPVQPKQEGKEQALYFDARVLDAQRRRHDVRGCRCRFLVRYDHDHSEEIVPLRKVCRRPETDYRLQILHAARAAASAEAQNVIVLDKSPVEQKPTKPHKMMDVNTAEVTMVSNPDQGEPTDKPAATLPAAATSTLSDSVSDVQMGDAEAAPVAEAANEAQDDKMNIGA